MFSSVKGADIIGCWELNELIHEKSFCHVISIIIKWETWLIKYVRFLLNQKRSLHWFLNSIANLHGVMFWPVTEMVSIAT